METKELKHKIKTELSQFLGVEIADINDDDDFKEDLQMEPVAISEFFEKLTSSGIDTSKVDFVNVSTIDDLLDNLEGASQDRDSEEI